MACALSMGGVNGRIWNGIWHPVVVPAKEVAVKKISCPAWQPSLFQTKKLLVKMANCSALKISLCYGLLACFWIMFSNRLQEVVIHDPDLTSRLLTFKNWTFVVLTTVSLFVIIRRFVTSEEKRILELERAEGLATLHRKTLELIIGGKPLKEILDHMLRGIEANSPEMLCSILLVDADGQHLRPGSAPSLPQEYVQATDGLPITPKMGSCGTAVFRRQQVIVSDIATDPLWEPGRAVALAHGLRACWSTPFFDDQKNVLGAFAIYHKYPSQPAKADEQVIDLATNLASTAIVKLRAEQALRETQGRFDMLVEHASDAIYIHDTQGKLLDVNRSACESSGYSREELLKMSAANLTPDKDQAQLQAIWQNMSPGQTRMIRSRHARKNGDSFPIEVSLSCYKVGGQIRMAALTRNVTQREEYEKRLAHNISLLRATIESSDSGVLVLNSNRKIAIFNHRLLEIWRIPAERVEEDYEKVLLPIAMKEPVHPEQFMARVQELREHPEQESRDTLFFKDGRVIMAFSAPQRLGDKIVGRVWNFRDQTKQFQAERFMRLQSVALETAANTIVITNSAGIIEWANPAFTRNTGYTLEEAAGRTPGELIGSGHHPPEFFKEMWDTILAGKVWQREIINRRKDGTQFIEVITITPLQDENQRIANFVAIKQDVTAYKRIEEELRQTSERAQFYVNRMPLAFIAWDQDFRVSEWNPAAERIFGWSAAEAIGRKAFDLIIPPEARPAFAQMQEQALHDRKLSGSSTHENFTKDQRRITCEWHNTPWRDSEGKICGGLSIVDDITEWVQTEKQRGDLEIQLRQAQKMEAIGLLSGGIAHDFNNILTVIQGNASMAQSLKLKPAETSECLSQISRAADRAASLTRQLLLFARKQQMQPVHLNLNESIAQMAKMLRRILGEDVELHAEYAPDLPLVHADIGMIEQIIMNLAVNARDAMKNGGAITLRTSFADDFVRLHVADTGSGIKPDVLPHIFEPFFTTKGVGQGTGLGLATVYGIVQQHHGKIDVQSEVGRGTTFTISLPACHEAAPQAGQDGHGAALPGGTETILLVEDEPSLRAYVRDLLQHCGYTVLAVANGLAALELWRSMRDHIALLVTDVIMPGNLNGIDLSRLLKADKTDLKVIYTSGYTGNLEDRYNLQLVEGRNLIRKPFKPGALAAIIRSHLDGKVVETPDPSHLAAAAEKK